MNTYKQYTITLDTNWCGTQQNYKCIVKNDEFNHFENDVANAAYESFLGFDGQQLVADDHYDGEIPENDDYFDSLCDESYYYDIEELYHEDDLLNEDFINSFEQIYILSCDNGQYILPTDIVWNNQSFINKEHCVEIYNKNIHFDLKEYETWK